MRAFEAGTRTAEPWQGAKTLADGLRVPSAIGDFLILLTLALVALIVLVGACGDPVTDDDRGYTKAPLENPGLVIEGEAESPMDDLGDPDLLNNRTPADPAGG